MKTALRIVSQPFPLITVQRATADHLCFVEQIIELIALSAKERGTGRGIRSYEEIAGKINKGQAVISISPEGKFVGFCYVEGYDEGKYFANSALIVSHEFRGFGISRQLKIEAFRLGAKIFPGASPISITTSAPVMKLNGELGYKAVTFSEISSDPKFWEGCKGCVNYSLLTKLDGKNCICTAMKAEPPKAKSALSRLRSVKKSS